MTTNSDPDLDIDHLRSWIGREDVASEVLTRELAQRFQATLDLPGPVPGTGDVVPRLIHFCLAPPVAPTSALGPDGHPRRGGFLPPVPLPRRMWAGGRLAFSDDLRVGDEVRRISRIADVAVKEGRTGILCFVTVEHAISVGGSIVLEERQDLVYRGEGGATKKDVVPADAGRHRRRVEPSSTLLFRYSALTFNGHRIHYDHPYATTVEGYPGLVVHGPLQATMLAHFGADLHGGPPSRFSFRSLSPLFDDAPFFLNAEEAGDGRMRLWTARENGPVAMEAEAEWV